MCAYVCVPVHFLLQRHYRKSQRIHWALLTGFSLVKFYIYASIAAFFDSYAMLVPLLFTAVLVNMCILVYAWREEFLSLRGWLLFFAWTVTLLVVTIVVAFASVRSAEATVVPGVLMLLLPVELLVFCKRPQVERNPHWVQLVTDLEAYEATVCSLVPLSCGCVYCCELSSGGLAIS